jgi:hypothetical protein
MFAGLPERTDRCTQRHAGDEDSGRTWVSWPADIQWDRRVKADSEHERCGANGSFQSGAGRIGRPKLFPIRNSKLETRN